MTAAITASAPTSVREALGRASARLAVAGCDSPRLDAELLVAHALGTMRERLLLDDRSELDRQALARVDAVIARREAREPVAYILGRKAFRHIELAVDRRVLIPRPETELLVELAVEALPAGARVADVGTGSGAIALALKHERPDLEVAATDASPDALAVARANAQRLGLAAMPADEGAVPTSGRRTTKKQHGVWFLEGHLLAPVSGPLDALVANLPYVADSEWVVLPPDVAGHEPRLALAGGPDGLNLIRRLVDQATEVPWLALEVGEGQARPVADLLTAAGRRTEVHRDLAGIDRVVVGRRP